MACLTEQQTYLKSCSMIDNFTKFLNLCHNNQLYIKITLVIVKELFFIINLFFQQITTKKSIDKQQEQEMEKLKNQEQKYVEQPQQPPQQPVEEKNPKKIIIVVGNMGHGKSSFIKMLVRQNQKQRIQCGSLVESVTKQIQYYQLDPQIAIKMNLNFKEPIYLMDTPGLNSKQEMLILPIIEQITSILIKKKFEVISFLYIIKPPQRIVKQKGSSQILEFHKLFPIKRSIKDKISLVVLTNFDQFHKTKQQDLQVYTKSLVSYLEKNQLKFSKNMLNWISEPTPVSNAFKIKLGIQMKQKQKKKWKNEYQNLSAEQYLIKFDEDYQDKLQLKEVYYNGQFKILGQKINQNLNLCYTYSLFTEGLVLQNNLLTKKIKEQIQAKNKDKRMSTTVWYEFETFQKDNPFEKELEQMLDPSNKIKKKRRNQQFNSLRLFPLLVGYIFYQLKKFFVKLQIKQLMIKTEKQIEQYKLKKTLMEVKQFYLLNIIDQIQRKSQKKQNVLIIQSSTSQWFKSAKLIKPYEKKFAPKDVFELEKNKKYEIQFEISLPSQKRLMEIIRECSLQVFYYDQN